MLEKYKSFSEHVKGRIPTGENNRQDVTVSHFGTLKSNF